MLTFWEWILWVLAWMSSDPTSADLEVPKAAAAVAAARASMLVEAPAPTPPRPKACDCGQSCVRGVWKPDGRIEQRCQCPCDRCKSERAKACPDGKCPNAPR